MRLKRNLHREVDLLHCISNYYTGVPGISPPYGPSPKTLYLARNHNIFDSPESDTPKVWPLRQNAYFRNNDLSKIVLIIFQWRTA
ncbi:hypothetical protein ROSI111154_18675 [Rouxiella silvae]